MLIFKIAILVIGYYLGIKLESDYNLFKKVKRAKI